MDLEVMPMTTTATAPAILSGGEFFSRLSCSRPTWIALVRAGRLPAPQVVVGTEGHRRPKYVYTDAYLAECEQRLATRAWDTDKGKRLRRALTAAGVS